MMIHCKNCKQKFYIMNEDSELEGKVIQCKYCNDQSIYESKTVYLENRLQELNKDLDSAEKKITYKKKEHQDRIDQLHKDLQEKKDELKKQTLLQNKVNDFESRLKETEKLNLEEVELGNEIKKMTNKIRTTSENISNQNKDIEKKTNYLETRINSYGSEELEEKDGSLNNGNSKNDTGEIVNINKNLNMSEKNSKNQQEENKKPKKFRFFTPGFID